MDSRITIDEGEDIDVICVFEDQGELVDPATPVSLRILRPCGEQETISEVEHADIGQFRYRYTVKEPGLYRYTFRTFDNAIHQGTFYARPDASKQGDK